MATNPKIQQKANDIRTKIYGKEVRESLASGLEVMSEDVEEIKGRQESVESQFQAVLDETTGKDVVSAPEILAARVSAKGEQHNNLKERLDKEHQEVTSQLAQNKKQYGRADIYTPQSSITPKAVYRVFDTVFVVTPKPSGKGYIRVRLEENVVTENQSVGGTGEFRRVTGVDNVLECFIMKTEHALTNNDNDWIVSPVSYVLPSNNSVEKIPTRQITNRSIGAFIEYELNIPKGMNSVEFLVYGTNGSSTDVDISINGEQFENRNFQRSTPEWFTISIPVKYGKNTIRFTTNTSQYMTLGGVCTELKDFSLGLDFDEVIVFRDGFNPYVSSSGAMDYAFLDAETDLWAGSYHGGETRSRLQYILDGEEITLNEGDKYIGNIFEMEQDTSIVNKLNAYTRHIFSQNGIIELEMVFDGEMKVTRFFANMTTTADSFDEIIYPVRHTLANEGNFYLPQGINYVVQKNASTNQKIITILNNNMFPSDKTPRPYIKKLTGAYNKLYNANIDSTEPVTFTGGNFRTVHIFE